MNWRRPWEHHVDHSFLPPNRRIVLSFDVRTKHRTDSRRSNGTRVRQTVVTTTRRSRLWGFQSSSNTHCRSTICCRRFGDLLGITQGDLEGLIVRLGPRSKCLFDWRALGGRVSGFGYGRSAWTTASLPRDSSVTTWALTCRRQARVGHRRLQCPDHPPPTRRTHQSVRLRIAKCAGHVHSGPAIGGTDIFTLHGCVGIREAARPFIASEQ